tara:strand:+ start:2058 stop:2429 length:372 start_codon:yes stop_codon:yes gene_type:complete
MNFDMAYYFEPRDGPLAQYFKDCRRSGAEPLFRGYGSYERLWNGGFIIPGSTVLRLNWDHGRTDEHFGILPDSRLEGISEAKFHAGRQGIHQYWQVLEEGVNFGLIGANSFKPKPGAFGILAG